MKIRILSSMLTFGWCLSLSIYANGQESVGKNCYTYEVDNPMAESVITHNTETWCYENLNQPAGAVYIFNADGEVIKPELAAVVEADGVMTHASLLAGEITVHRVMAGEYNPLSVPLTPPTAMVSFSLPLEKQTQISGSAAKVLNFLLDQPAEVGLFSVQAGTYKASVSEGAKPWKGFWWPYKNRPMATPLSKYDRFVKAHSGSNPGALAWEDRNHRYKGVSWEGHCNGWAASSVLRREPTVSKTDAASGVTFTVSDQKGILAEMDYCPKTAFFGSRYRGSGDRRDIYPALFHKTLVYYISQVGKPVATDYMSGSSVDNHIISGYTMNIRSTGANTFSVTTKINIHRYDKGTSSTPGKAPMYTRTYNYSLVVDGSGNPTGGSWSASSPNPDFLWVPLALGDCARNNPAVTEQWIQRIFSLN